MREEVVYRRVEEMEASAERRLSEMEDLSEEVGRSLDRLQPICEAAESNLYELFRWGSLSAFQGVIIACIAHTSSLTCRYSFPLFILSSFTIIATFVATFFLLARISQRKEDLLLQKRRLSQVLNRISCLREAGPDFDIANALSEEQAT